MTKDRSWWQLDQAARTIECEETERERAEELIYAANVIIEQMREPMFLETLRAIQMPPGSANPSNRAATLTPSP